MTPKFTVKVKTSPPDLISRLRGFKTKFDSILREAMSRAIEVVHERAPRYPRNPAGSRYKRTGNLGRSIGKDMRGRNVGEPDLFNVKKIGTQHYTGHVGSFLGYSPKVIGENQRADFTTYWWNVFGWAKRSRSKVRKVYLRAMEKAARTIA
jgi:hypothetical protein